MVQQYYRMSYGEYKEHCTRIGNCVGHSEDDRLTDESIITLRVTAEDHVHHYLESLGFEPLAKLTFGSIHPTVQAHPIMKYRG